MRFVDLRSVAPAAVRVGRWAVVFATLDAFEHASALGARFGGAPVVACTSSGGVFTPGGFERGAFALIGDEGDTALAAVARTATADTARAAARAAVGELLARMEPHPSTLLLYATPGFEERILEGIGDAYDGQAPPIYGGSAADDDLSGQWRLALGAQTIREGFVLAGLAHAEAPLGAFVSGYLPGKQHGVVTKARGRTIAEIDGEPAARVYSRWLDGRLDDAVEQPRVVLADTTLHPLGREVDRIGQVPRYLLSHPHEIGPNGTLSLFTEIAVGDTVACMVGFEGGLMERTEQVVQRARAQVRYAVQPTGGILVYCGGCVMAIGKRAADVGRMYGAAIGGAPFVGAATFGEVGCFTGRTPVNRHGNLMCSTVLFR
jgi:hypothetical protein